MGSEQKAAILQRIVVSNVIKIEAWGATVQARFAQVGCFCIYYYLLFALVCRCNNGGRSSFATNLIRDYRQISVLDSCNQRKKNKNKKRNKTERRERGTFFWRKVLCLVSSLRLFFSFAIWRGYRLPPLPRNQHVSLILAARASVKAPVDTEPWRH